MPRAAYDSVGIYSGVCSQNGMKRRGIEKER